jgi:hypothetical protein
MPQYDYDLGVLGGEAQQDQQLPPELRSLE